MNAQNTFSRDDVFKYTEFWKDTLASRKELYGSYLNGAIGGLLTMIVTIGLNFDALEQFGWLEKSLLGSVVFLLLLAGGNIMNCLVFATNARLDILRLERELILTGSDNVPGERLQQLNQQLCAGEANAQKYFPNCYFSMLLAVLLGVIGFIVILIRF